ncbi:HCL559Wp [Eremothecium sinecaudum]|uniref:HCL559Wp n=1 Tax=Eremothecium sinecaudum TaxID=45286 RepID=A0A120K1P4_9SACH|nr:HCL559Wp [Eremothecium sinecaudum]AMD19592.1 HCL559Wp [Eremothecium sinecaudum]
MSNSLLLSECMLQSEKSVAYSTSFSSELYAHSNVCQFTISTSESQGFSWNQDIFASQYQQLCKVIYDGHVDSVDTLIQKITPPSYQDENICRDVFHDDEMEQEGDYSDGNVDSDRYATRSTDINEWRNRLTRELSKPRRKSERSISFVSDSKNGTYRVADVIEIDVNSATPENVRLRALVDDL